MYAIVASVRLADGSVRHLPTFYLNADVQGIVNAEHARQIAREIVVGFVLHMSAEKV